MSSCSVDNAACAIDPNKTNAKTKVRVGLRQLLALSALVAVALSDAPSAQTMEEMKAELAASRQMQAQMMQMMKDQDQRIRSLESQLDETGQPVTTSAPIVDLAPGAAAPSPTDPVRWNELTGKEQRLRIYGFARADAIYDDSRANSSGVIGFIRSEDPDAPPGIGAPDDVNNFNIHAKLTRVGLDITGDEIAALAGAKPFGKVEIDFYGATTTPSRPAPRMRHAYGKMSWGDFSILGGQTTDVIAPLYPSVNPDLAMWGAGNLGDRRPQFRIEWTPAVGPGKLTLTQMLGSTGADDAQDLDPAGTTGIGFLDGETSGLGTLQGRVAYSFDMFDKQKFELGGSYHRAWEEPDTQFGGDDLFDSYALALDLRLPIWKDFLWATGELWYGKNTDDVRGGNFQGINTVTGDEIYGRGGWVELSAKLFPWWVMSAGYSTDDPTDGDLNIGGRVDNDIYYLTNRWNFKPMSFGFDWQHWETDYKGFDSGDNNRFQWFLQYDF